MAMLTMSKVDSPAATNGVSGWMDDGIDDRIDDDVRVKVDCAHVYKVDNIIHSVNPTTLTTQGATSPHVSK